LTPNPNKGEQMARYYGYYSNVARGKRKEAGTDDAIPCILEPQGNSKAFRRSWARLIQKIYEVDPLVCPKCKSAMRIISFIEDRQVIRAIPRSGRGQALNTWDYGWPEQGRRRKSTIRLFVYKAQAGRLFHLSRMTPRRSPFMTITSMGIRNTHGMITSKHNAKKAYRMGLPKKHFNIPS